MINTNRMMVKTRTAIPHPIPIDSGETEADDGNDKVGSTEICKEN